MPRKQQDPEVPDFYRPIDADNPVLWAGRHRFFEAIASKVPEVLIELRDRVLPVVLQAFIDTVPQLVEFLERGGGDTQEDSGGVHSR